jgi:hypothetical protein
LRLPESAFTRLRQLGRRNAERRFIIGLLDDETVLKDHGTGLRLAGGVSAAQQGNPDD